jgi:hypothetical protein
METFIKNFLTKNWQRKFISLLAAIIVWTIVSASITTTRVFTRIPVRIVNLPPHKTIRGLMPDGFLDKRITITLTGSKDVIDRLGSQDFEVVVDASDKGDEWVAKITKNNLLCLNPDVHLVHSIRALTHSELVIRLCPLVTAKIPVFVRLPKEEPPEGYQFLDVWPQKLYHVISGPEEDIRQLQEDGLELNLDLMKITPEQLDALRGDGPGDDEVAFFVPDVWKKVAIPFLHNAIQTINGQEARQLRIDFLYKAVFPIDGPVPIRLFYPGSTLSMFNPSFLSLQPNKCVVYEKGVFLFDQKLYVSDVSRLFLDIVRDRLEITIVPVNKDGKPSFHWSVQCVDPHQLEEAYVTIALSSEYDTDSHIGSGKAFRQHLLEREQYFRSRFQRYLRSFHLYKNRESPLALAISCDDDGHVVIEDSTQ